MPMRASIGPSCFSPFARERRNATDRNQYRQAAGAAAYGQRSNAEAEVLGQKRTSRAHAVLCTETESSAGGSGKSFELGREDSNLRMAESAFFHEERSRSDG
jgi:hypothetical protein